MDYLKTVVPSQLRQPRRHQPRSNCIKCICCNSLPTFSGCSLYLQMCAWGCLPARVFRSIYHIALPGVSPSRRMVYQCFPCEIRCSTAMQLHRRMQSGRGHMIL